MPRRPTQLLLIALLLTMTPAWLAPRAAWALTDQDIATLQIDPPRELPRNVPGNVPSLSGILARLGLALGVVFGLMGLVVWLARKYLPQAASSRRGGAIEILASRPIGARRSLMLVRTQGKTLLLGVTPQSIQALSELEDAAADWHEAAWQAGLEGAAAAPAAAGTTSLERFGP
jgi:flagellar biosynthetic protein FliO